MVSTTDFDSVCPGSSPGKATIKIKYEKRNK